MLTDGYVVLILLLQLQTRRQLRLVMKRRIRHGYRNLQPTAKSVPYWLDQGPKLFVCGPHKLLAISY